MKFWPSAWRGEWDVPDVLLLVVAALGLFGGLGLLVLQELSARETDRLYDWLAEADEVIAELDDPWSER